MKNVMHANNVPSVSLKRVSFAKTVNSSAKRTQQVWVLKNPN
jgi:hypothetical protein